MKNGLGTSPNGSVGDSYDVGDIQGVESSATFAGVRNVPARPKLHQPPTEWTGLSADRLAAAIWIEHLVSPHTVPLLKVHFLLLDVGYPEHHVDDCSLQDRGSLSMGQSDLEGFAFRRLVVEARFLAAGFVSASLDSSPSSSADALDRPPP